MQKEINLLPKKNIGILQKEKTIIVVRIVAIFSVVFVLTSWIGVLLLGKNYSLDTVEAQQASVRSRLRTFQNKTTESLALVDRTRKIQEVLKNRSLLTDKINLLQKQIPQGVNIESFTITTTGISLSISSSSLSSLKKFIDSISALVIKKSLLQKVTITDVIVDAVTGKYTVNITGVLL